MSTPAAPEPPASPSGAGNHPTRQLLDELDALMQRMLALPVHQLEEELRGAAVGTSAAVSETLESQVNKEAGAQDPATGHGGPFVPGPLHESMEEVGLPRADAPSDMTPPHAPL